LKKGTKKDQAAALSHINAKGEAHMVDVGDKDNSKRHAKAAAEVQLNAQTFALIKEGSIAKGDVLSVARIAGIQAAKQTAHLIPLCHPLMLSHIDIEFVLDEKQQLICIEANCSLNGKTGVEMEALTAASVAALTIYDMCKAVDKGIVISNIRLLEKSGGKSGKWKQK